MRRKPEEEHENHERWMVSYADFVTLLFAFFVVMYAISSVNEGKYRVLSTAITNAFRTGGSVTVVAAPPTGSANTMIEIPQTRPIAKAIKTDTHVVEQLKLNRLAQDLRRVLDPLVKGGQVKITQTTKGVAIEIKDSALFPVGQATPSAQTRDLMTQMAHVLSTVDNSVSVEGFTDDIPISNPTFPSNWELSAARAGSVVRLFQENGIVPERMVAVGRAANTPVANNSSADGRARNRRVAITVLTNDSDSGSARLPLEQLEALSQAAATANGNPGAQPAQPTPAAPQ